MATRVPLPAPPSRLPAAGSWLPEGLARPLRVLLVEDDPADAGRVLGWLAAELRLETRRAATLAETLERLARECFDLVLLDMVLPDGQGLTVVERVVKAAPEATVVVLTGLEGPDLELAHAAVARGAADFLPKRDVVPPLLVRALWGAFERADIRRRLRERAYDGGPVRSGRWRLSGGRLRLSPDLAGRLGLSPEVPPSALRRLLAPGEGRRLARAARRARRNGRPRRLAVRLADRRRLLVEIHVEPDGSLAGSCHEPGFPAAVDALREAFVALLAHEVRTPLTAIRGALDLAGRLHGAELPPRVCELLEMASRNAVRLEALVADLLDLQQLSKREAAKERIDVGALLRGILDVHADEARRRGVDVDVEAIPSLMVETDAQRLSRLLERLVAHALRTALPGARLSCETEAGARLAVTLSGAHRGLLASAARDVLPAGSWRVALCGAELDLAIVRAFAHALGVGLHVEPVDGGVRLVLDAGGIACRKERG